MQDFWETIKRSNLQIMGIEGKEEQAKGIENMFSKIIAENFPNLEKEVFIQDRRLLGLKTDKTRKEPSHIIL
jgi:hypothetical protein